METAAELILRGHFSKLKDEANRQGASAYEGFESEIREVMGRMFRYLRNQQADGRLDEEGLEIYQQLEQLLNGIRESDKMDVPGKLPMQKAGAVRKKGSRRKTG